MTWDMHFLELDKILCDLHTLKHPVSGVPNKVVVVVAIVTAAKNV